MPKGKYIRPVRSAVFPIGPSIAYLVLTQGFYSLVDWDDALELQKFPWHARKRTDGKSLYASRTGNKFLHLEVNKTPSNLFTDHKNGTTLDNRRANLRNATPSENSINKCMPSHNTSGFKGVSFHKRIGKYCAQLKKRARSMHLGYFDTPEKAALAYSQAASREFGEFQRA